MPVYELVQTYEETYWPLGLFPSIQEANATVCRYLEKNGEPPRETRFEPGSRIILELKIRHWGLDSSDEKAWQRVWLIKWDEMLDIATWEEGT
jgi:hypothetical protein